MEEEQLLLESLAKEHTIRRRKLLPVWIKVFIWIFMIMGGFAVPAFIAGMFSLTFQISLYGLESHHPFSSLGIFLFFLFILKGFVAFGLWMEKDWAVDLGIADALIGIIVCTGVMLTPSLRQSPGFSFRLELVLLIPYLIKLLNIRTVWKNAGNII